MHVNGVGACPPAAFVSTWHWPTCVPSHVPGSGAVSRQYGEGDISSTVPAGQQVASAESEGLSESPPHLNGKPLVHESKATSSLPNWQESPLPVARVTAMLSQVVPTPIKCARAVKLVPGRSV